MTEPRRRGSSRSLGGEICWLFEVTRGSCGQVFRNNSRKWRRRRLAASHKADAAISVIGTMPLFRALTHHIEPNKRMATLSTAFGVSALENKRKRASLVKTRDVLGRLRNLRAVVGVSTRASFPASRARRGANQTKCDLAIIRGD